MSDQEDPNRLAESPPHHCAPSDYAAMIGFLQAVEAGDVRVGDQDWRTRAGVLARMLAYATRCTDAGVDSFLDLHAEVTRLTQETTELRQENARLKADHQRLADAAEMLWVVLANVSGGDWEKQSSEWQDAAARWRDNYIESLKPGWPGSHRIAAMSASTDSNTTGIHSGSTEEAAPLPQISWKHDLPD